MRYWKKTGYRRSKGWNIGSYGGNLFSKRRMPNAEGGTKFFIFEYVDFLQGSV